MSLPSGAYQDATISYLDAGNEVGRFRCFGKVITAANHDAQEALWVTLVAAADALVLGVRIRNQYSSDNVQVGTQPTNGAAREIKLLVQYIDDTNGKRMTCSLPTLDPTLPDYVVNINAKDVILLDSPTEISDFIAAFEAFAINPEQPTHTVSVIGLKVVGRAT